MTVTHVCDALDDCKNKQDFIEVFLEKNCGEGQSNLTVKKPFKTIIVAKLLPESSQHSVDIASYCTDHFVPVAGSALDVFDVLDSYSEQ
jgi:hypothetical protein